MNSRSSVPTDLEDEFNAYQLLIQEKRRAYWASMKFTVPAAAVVFLIGLCVCLFARVSNYFFLIGFAVSMFISPRVLDFPTRHQRVAIREIEEIFARRGLRICHDPGLSVDVVPIDRG